MNTSKIMPPKSSDDSFGEHIKRITENYVPDPDMDGLVNISTMSEKEFVNLFDRSWSKVKRIKTRHWSKHGWILNCLTILNKLYEKNVHKWGRDEGRSGESLEAFKHYLAKQPKESSEFHPK